MVYEVVEEASTGITYVLSLIRGGGKKNKGMLRVKWLIYSANINVKKMEVIENKKNHCESGTTIMEIESDWWTKHRKSSADAAQVIRSAKFYALVW
ncbi:hypothetical protein CR513_60459, partial [Mucuna pruriens]